MMNTNAQRSALAAALAAVPSLPQPASLAFDDVFDFDEATGKMTAKVDSPLARQFLATMKAGPRVSKSSTPSAPVDRVKARAKQKAAQAARKAQNKRAKGK